MAIKRKPPANNVRTVRSNGQNTPGTTMASDGTILQFESFGEDKLLLRLLRDRTVLGIVSQPVTIEWTDSDGKRHRYVPDYKVERADGPVEVHEVTRSERLAREDIARRTHAAQQFCEERGWLYLLHTEHTLPSGIELANLQALAMYRARGYFNAVVAEAAWSLLSHVGGPLLVAALIQHLTNDLGLPQGTVTSALCHLMWQGDLEVDMRRLLFADGALTPLAAVRLPLQQGR